MHVKRVPWIRLASKAGHQDLITGNLFAVSVHLLYGFGHVKALGPFW
jgi:hypothetical protein